MTPAMLLKVITSHCYTILTFSQETEVGMKWKKIFSELARFFEKITPFNLVKHRSTNTFTRKLYHGIYEATVYSGDGTKLTKKNIPLLRHQGDKEVTIWV